MITTSSLIAPTLAAAGAILLLLAYRDLSQRRLPNAWVGLYAFLFLCYAGAAGIGWAQVGGHAITGLAAFTLATLLFALGYMGGGDVKLWGAIMLWAGPQGAVTALVLATLCGALLGLLGWGAQRVLRRARRPAGAGMLRMLTASRGVPYGVGLALAGIQVLIVTGA
ncbi:peptidase A24 [Pusillimonas sp. TS35]|uniref:A24 family peptidase n=1 Tax=Paracandidimonas lactea TaxID=2895524 RepID=UPI00136F1117|nr:prepilin peptidase [Paracandidimonas lactea]MYN13500.1 peptidase A24 [Pusillimonas sp. TS35]